MGSVSLLSVRNGVKEKCVNRLHNLKLGFQAEREFTVNIKRLVVLRLLVFTHVNKCSFQWNTLSCCWDIWWKKSIELHEISIPFDRVKGVSIQVKQTGQKERRSIFHSFWYRQLCYSKSRHHEGFCRESCCHCCSVSIIRSQEKRREEQVSLDNEQIIRWSRERAARQEEKIWKSKDQWR